MTDLRMLDEAQGGGVHAVTQSRRFGAIVEDVTEVRIAFGARDSGTNHPESTVANLRHIFFGDRLPEARPARAGIEFRSRIKQRIVAADAAVQSLLVQVPVLAGEGQFGVGLPRNVISIRRQLLAPLICSLDNFGSLNFVETFASIRETKYRDLLGFTSCCRSGRQKGWPFPLPEGDPGDGGE